MPRCASAGLSHAVGRRLEQGAAAEGVGGILHDDLFVPKQLGWGWRLGLVWLSPAVMVRKRSRSSAAVRLRCHAVRHSPGAACGAGLAHVGSVLRVQAPF